MTYQQVLGTWSDGAEGHTKARGPERSEPQNLISSGSLNICKRIKKTPSELNFSASEASQNGEKTFLVKVLQDSAQLDWIGYGTGSINTSKIILLFFSLTTGTRLSLASQDQEGSSGGRPGAWPRKKAPTVKTPPTKKFLPNENQIQKLTARPI